MREPVCLLSDRAQREQQFVVCVWRFEGELYLGAEQGEWRAEFVACVGEESALAVNTAFDPLEHRVERFAKASDLVACSRHGQALGEIPIGDRACAHAHSLHRPQRASRNEVADQRGDQERDRAADEQFVA